MAIKISGTTVIDDSRNITNVVAVGDTSTTTFLGDGSGLTGVQAGSASFTATGAISNGATVIINSDGTISAVAEQAGDAPIIGSESIFHSANTANVAAAYDPDQQRVIVCYRDDADGSYGKAVVGTVSGSDITFGTEVTFNSASSGQMTVAYDTNTDRALVSYASGGAEYGTARVLTISGNSISVGNANTFHFGSTGEMFSVFDSSNNKVVITYRDTGSSNRGRAIVATITGGSTNTVSFGSEATWIDAFVNYHKVVFDSTNNKVVICGGYTSDNKAKAYVGTVSGTDITFGSASQFSNSGSYNVGAAFDTTNDKVVIVFRDATNSSYMAGIVGTVSGTNISFGSTTYINSFASSELSATYDSQNDKVVAVTGTTSKVYMGTVSGTSITFDGGSTFNSGGASYTAPIFDTTNNVAVISYRDTSNNNKAASVVVDNTGTNASSATFLGIAAEAISNGSSGSVTIVTGINASQSGLTAGQQYFVQRDGTLDTTADNPSLLAGTAISATKLIVKR